MGKIKPISISLSPNTEKDDIWLAFKLAFFQSWRWGRGKAVNELEEEFRKYLGVKYAFAFNSGRSCLIAILKSLELNPGDEVLAQAFTCNAAINPIIWSGLKPVYVDCNEDTFNIDLDDLRRKVTSKSRVVMVQHTFGIPAEIVKESNLILIEDCAHALGAEINGQKVGTFGKAGFFSFSRDKIISSVYGGMVVTNDDELAQKIKEFQKELKLPSQYWVFQQLLHPILMNFLILPTYRILGKYLLVLFQKIGLLSKAVHWKEKQAQKPEYFPKRMPNALALLALNQFKKLEDLNYHRKEIKDFYLTNLRDSSFRFAQIPENSKPVFLRFPIKHSQAQNIIKKAWKKNLLIGDWYTSPIAPDDTNLDKMEYKIGSCPKAEKLARETFNLPTHINIKKDQADKVVRELKMLFQKLRL